MSGAGRELLDVKAHEMVAQHIERIGAERNVIAYVLHNPESIYDVAVELKDTDFNNTINKIIYGHMLTLMGKGIAVSSATITAMLKHHSDVKPEDIDDYISVIDKTSTVGMDIKYNVELAKRASVKRQAYYKALDVLLDCTDENYEESAAEFIGRQEGKFLDLSLRVDSVDKVVNLGDKVAGYLEEKAKNPRQILGLQTGFPQLDWEIGGLCDKRMYVFAARAKAGKSALLTNLASNLSLVPEEKQSILMISTEMSDEENLGRILAKLSGVPEKLISNGMFTESSDMIEKVQKAKDLVESGRFFHVYMPNFTVDNLVSLARRYKIKENIKVLIFDYIKLPSENKSNLQAHLLLGKIATTLKDIAGTLGIVVLTAAQLNRSAVNEESMSEDMVRGSDEILFYADYLFMLRNKTEKEIESENSSLGNSILQLVASRHGGNYKGALNFNRPTLDFEEVMNMDLG